MKRFLLAMVAALVLTTATYAQTVNVTAPAITYRIDVIDGDDHVIFECSEAIPDENLQVYWWRSRIEVKTWFLSPFTGQWHYDFIPAGDWKVDGSEFATAGQYHDFESWPVIVLDGQTEWEVRVRLQKWNTVNEILAGGIFSNWTEYGVSPTQVISID